MSEWMRVLGLPEADRFNKEDRAVLAIYCEAVARWEAADAMVPENGGELVTVNGQPVPNPWRTIANKAGEQILKYAAELGLTPIARTRRSPAADATDKSAIERFLESSYKK